ncbi:MAG: hypothetical protein ABI645_05875, partial [Pseudomonadota bacterium]
MTDIRMDLMKMDVLATRFVFALVLGGTFAVQAAAPAPAAADPLEIATRIQKEVVQLRGLPFKKPVPMETQTAEGLGQRMDKELAEAVPTVMAEHFDKIVRRLGLYRGPEIKDYR